MLDRVWLDRVWLLLCLESTCSACRIVNSHEQTRAQFFTFLLGTPSVSSKDRASLSVLLAVVSVGIVSSSASLALEVKGLQEAVELDSKVELLEPEHANMVQLFIETRVTWLMQTTPT